ncbi:unnamed protein product, partial [Ectocarpus sp. 12 AP-2014]
DALPPPHSIPVRLGVTTERPQIRVHGSVRVGWFSSHLPFQSWPYEVVWVCFGRLIVRHARKVRKTNLEWGCGRVARYAFRHLSAVSGRAHMTYFAGECLPPHTSLQPSLDDYLNQALLILASLPYVCSALRICWKDHEL